MRDIDWDEASRSHDFRIEQPFAKHVLTLAELDLLVTEFDEGCGDGQRRFLEFVMKSVMSEGERERWYRDADIRSYLLRWEIYKRSRDEHMTGRYWWDRMCGYKFSPREDFGEFCAYCGNMPEDHERFRLWQEKGGSVSE